MSIIYYAWVYFAALTYSLYINRIEHEQGERVSETARKEGLLLRAGLWFRAGT